MRIRPLCFTQLLAKFKYPGRRVGIPHLVACFFFLGLYGYWMLFMYVTKSDLALPENSQEPMLKSPTSVPVVNRTESHPELDSNMIMAQTVRLAMVHSWKAYRLYAWGKDETEPMRQSGTKWMGTALTMIDALDTLWIMGLTKEFSDARNWIAANLKFDTDNEHISFFVEFCLNILVRLQQELGPLLLVAFRPHFALPMPDVNFAKRTARYSAWSTQHSLSEVSSIQMEFNQLSLLTKDDRYAFALTLPVTVHARDFKSEWLQTLFATTQAAQGGI
ncbi:unnamed protein product [Echinostoma caproni]|uniref:alpha-1,2-Mannosidase n=1 Tax=Echinostoma caproni TaxID=27848 RepID=A0A183AL83_9TREM|nr:unnamed protein product [Echinostoma caproni]